MVGRTIVEDLAIDFEVTVADIDPDALKPLSAKEHITTRQIGVDDDKILKELMADKDLIVTAVPGSIGYNTLKLVIEQDKNVVDISFFEEDPFGLNELAIKHEVTAIVDCGIAPGLSNLILGHYNSRIEVSEFSCYVGGLPVNREKPFEYKAPFSVSDVLEEYTRDARFVVNGEIVIKPSLTDIELLKFDEIGELEAFNTDGLRTLLKMTQIPNMKEKTLRYPGHAELMKSFREAGLFDKDLVEVNGLKIRPIDLTLKLLSQSWKLQEGEPELTVMKVNIMGKVQGEEVHVDFSLYDKYDAEKNHSSMSRTTGFTCTAVARMILENKFNHHGVFPPELLSREDGSFEYVLDKLKERNVNINLVESSVLKESESH